jgi:hypothetical protein
VSYPPPRHLGPGAVSAVLRRRRVRSVPLGHGRHAERAGVDAHAGAPGALREEYFAELADIGARGLTPTNDEWDHPYARHDQVMVATATLPGYEERC